MSNTKIYCVIVESGSKCAKIMSYLGTSYNCIASNGHIRTIKNLSDIHLDTHTIDFIIDPDKEEHVKKMQSVLKNYPKANIILGTDHDREGEAIAWHLCQVFNLPVETTKRIVFHEITKPALQYAIANPRTIDLNLVYSQQARQVLDMIVGFKISPLLWRLTSSSKSALSAGRCQTPALRLIYENDKCGFDKETCVYHHVNASFSKGLGDKFLLNHDFDNTDDLHAFMQTSTTWKHIMSISKPSVVNRECPKPFNTASLLQAASNHFSASTKDITAACQTLYQLGHITYMRTDAQKYSPVFIDAVSKYISDKWANNYVGNLTAITMQENSLNPHEAIRPTNLQMHELLYNNTTITASTSDLISRVYRLIWINTVQSCMASERLQCQTIQITAPNNFIYKKTLELVLFSGFKALAPVKTTLTAEQLSSINMMFNLSKNNEVDAELIQSVPFVKETRHYTEASLINCLDGFRIGRPSTFSMFVDVIQDRNYVVKTNIPAKNINCVVYTYSGSNRNLNVSNVEKKFGQEHGKLLITPLGSVVCEYLLNEFETIFSYEYTNNMEQQLDMVAAGHLIWTAVCNKCLSDVVALVNPLMKVSYPLDNGHELYFHTDKKTGKVSPLIRRAIAQKRFEYKRVKPDLQINYAKLKRGEYTVAELAVLPEGEYVIGTYADKDIVVKSGKFGIYAECGETRVPMSSATQNKDEVVKLFENKDNKQPILVRELTPELSIRNGPHGHYIFYLTKKMKKPKFFDVSSFGNTYETCDKDELINWIVGKYKLKTCC